MESNSLISDLVDPLQGLIGPSLFPRAIRAAANCPIPSCSKDLDSIHHFMKSLDLRSPEKLMKEAKRIVDGGVELLDSNLIRFSEAVDPRDDVIVKGKDKPQERRQGLGIARKTARFSLKPSARSQPSQNLESTLNIDQFADPDEYFDAIERHENALKEIQRQQGGIMNNLNDVIVKGKDKPQERRQGLGIARKTARFSLKPSARSQPSQNLESTLNIDQLADPDEYFDAIERRENALKEIQRQQGGVMNDLNDVIVKGKDKPQERRQGLGIARKTARFSLKPSARSQPSQNLESTLNIDQLADPDEYFDAIERRENALKEIQRQQGGIMNNLNEHKPSTNKRHRRQGILGKSYSYKHRYSSVPSENDEMLISSQGTMETDVVDASNPDLQQKLDDSSPSEDDNLQEVELAESTMNTEDKVNGVLDELLSCNAEDLDGDGAMNILQEMFQIKPLDPNCLRLPNYHNAGMSDFIDWKEGLSKPRKTSQVTNGLLRSVSGEAPIEHCGQVDRNPTSSVASPTPPRSPFASLFLLNKRISQSNPQRDPFTPLNIDLSSNACPVQPIEKPQDQVDAQKEASTCSKKNAHKPTIDMNIQKVKLGSPDCLPDQFADENASGQTAEAKTIEVAIHMDSHKLKTSSSDSLDQIANDNSCRQSETSIISEIAINMDKPNVNGSSDSQPDQFVDENASGQTAEAKTSGPTIHMDTHKSKTSSSDSLHQIVDDNSCSQSETIIISELAINMDKPNVNGSLDRLPDQFVDENASRSATADIYPNVDPCYNVEEERTGHNLNGDQSNCCTLEDDEVNAPSRSQQPDQEQEPEKNQDKTKKTKREAGEKRLKKSHPLRKSLAEAGTSFENGVRRSKRIRMRPLDYWKGERFIYGRLDESLKLIGVKYFSPGKDAPGMKVKPYVSPQYKELVEMAARP